MTAGVAAVQARVAEIQQVIEQLNAGSTTASGSAAQTTATQTGGTAAATAATTTADAFAQVLAQVTAAGHALTASAGAASSTATGEQAVQQAMAYLGVPYLWGGTDPATGMDCSALVQRVFGDLGVELPRTVAEQATVGTEVAGLAEAVPGDLVVFDGSAHIGIYLGDGMMVDAPKPGQAVQVREVYQTPTSIRRVLPTGSGGDADGQGGGTTAGASAAVAQLAGAVDRLALVVAAQGLTAGLTGTTTSGLTGTLATTLGLGTGDLTTSALSSLVDPDRIAMAVLVNGAT